LCEGCVEGEKVEIQPGHSGVQADFLIG